MERIKYYVICIQGKHKASKRYFAGNFPDDMSDAWRYSTMIGAKKDAENLDYKILIKTGYIAIEIKEVIETVDTVSSISLV